MTIAANITVPAIGHGRDSFRISTDKGRGHNAAAWARFQDDSIVSGLIREAGIRGHSFKFDEVRFIDGGSDGGGGEWIAIAVWGQRGQNQGVILTGYYNSASGEIEHVTMLTITGENGRKQQQVRIDSQRYDRGKLGRQASVTYDAHTEQWTGHDGTVLKKKGQASGALGFGSPVSAAISPDGCDFICNLVLFTHSLIICSVVAFLTAFIGGVICEVVYMVISWLTCKYADYDC